MHMKRSRCNKIVSCEHNGYLSISAKAVCLAKKTSLQLSRVSRYFRPLLVMWK